MIDADAPQEPDVDDDLDGVVYTAGVSSAVLRGDDAVGHVLLIDVDDHSALEVYRAAERLAESDVVAMWESSPGSYHLWSLGVRPWETSVLDGLSWRIADSEHVAQSYRRGRYVLRVSPKVRDDGSTYKRAPELRDVWVPDDPDRPQSRPHLGLLKERARESDVRTLRRVESYEGDTVGDRDGLAVDRYMTLSDDLKREVRERESRRR